MVLADSNGISRAPSYLGYFHKAAERISTTGLSPSTVRHSNRFAYTPAPHFTSPAELIRKVPQPRPCNARRLSHMARFSLFRVRSPLLTESLLFSLPVGTEMFHFPTFPPTALYIQAEVAGHDSGISRFPYSEIPGSGARLPAPLGLSQVTTSFFGSWCQGIHRSHLVAC